MTLRTLTVGEATVSIINIGDLYLPLADKVNLSDSAKQDNLYGIAEQERLPIQFFHIQLPHTSVLVDAGLYDVETHPIYAIDGYEPPPSLIAQLADAGIAPDSIEHVVITHRHWDHFNATTVEQDGMFVPQFPNAVVYLGQADWDTAQDALQVTDSPESKTLKVLNERDKLILIDGETDIAEGVQVIPTPGETPGHQIVRIESNGEVAYFLGDLYHHLIETVDVTWTVDWADRESIVPSRKLFEGKAVADHGLVLATHIVEIGRMKQTDEGVIWEAATDL